jgi:hypothetical protein
VIETILTPAGPTSSIPNAFIYRAGIEPSVMQYQKGPYTTTQVILKPHALNSLLGIDAAAIGALNPYRYNI